MCVCQTCDNNSDMQLIIPPVKGLSPARRSMWAKPSEDRLSRFTVKRWAFSTQLSIYTDELNSTVARDWVPRSGNLCLTHDLLQIQSRQCHVTLWRRQCVYPVTLPDGSYCMFWIWSCHCRQGPQCGDTSIIWLCCQYWCLHRFVTSLKTLLTQTAPDMRQSPETINKIVIMLNHAVRYKLLSNVCSTDCLEVLY